MRMGNRLRLRHEPGKNLCFPLCFFPLSSSEFSSVHVYARIGIRPALNLLLGIGVLRHGTPRPRAAFGVRGKGGEGRGWAMLPWLVG